MLRLILNEKDLTNIEKAAMGWMPYATPHTHPTDTLKLVYDLRNALAEVTRLEVELADAKKNLYARRLCLG